jgi:predicted RNase H-like HicB family nuclease
MSKPNYRVVISFDGERKTYTARVPELAHCTAEGATRAEAMSQLEQELEAILAGLASQGKLPPPAIDDVGGSGELTVKVSKGLHRELLWQAASEGVEVGQLAGEMLSSALEHRRNARPRRPQDGQHSDNRGQYGDNRGQHGDNRGQYGDNRGQYGDNRGRSYDGGARRGGPQQGGRSPALLDDRAHFIEYVRNLEGDARRGPAPRDDRRGEGRPDRGRRGGGPGPGPGHDRGPDRGRPSSGGGGGSGGDHGAPSGNSERGS